MANQPSRPRIMWPAFLVLGLIVVALAFTSPLFKSPRTDRAASSVSPTPTPPPSPFLPKPAPTATPLPVPAVAAAGTPAAPRSAEEEVGEIGLSLRDYRQALGFNPVGNNEEITRALLGDNPRNIAFLERSEFKFNDKGELIDRWDHPYFFHAITSKVMEVRSAGPDGVMFTADDITAE